MSPLLSFSKTDCERRKEIREQKNSEMSADDTKELLRSIPKARLLSFLEGNGIYSKTEEDDKRIFELAIGLAYFRCVVDREYNPNDEEFNDVQNELMEDPTTIIKIGKLEGKLILASEICNYLDCYQPSHKKRFDFSKIL